MEIKMLPALCMGRSTKSSPFRLREEEPMCSPALDLLL
jgi:hypothetical protein